MRQPIHAMAAGRREMTPERVVGIGFVVLLHVIVIWAIMNGLVQKIVKAVEAKPIVVTVEHKEVVKPPVVQPPVVPLPTLQQAVDVQPPVIDIAPDARGPIEQTRPQQLPQVRVANIAPDTAAAGIMSTHTIPPYPLLATRFQEQGSVKLSLTISAQGVVTAANVVQSSGFADLDQAAVGWVLGHWRYKPASQAGQPVASTALAMVVFSLRNAR